MCVQFPFKPIAPPDGLQWTSSVFTETRVRAGFTTSAPDQHVEGKEIKSIEETGASCHKGCTSPSYTEGFELSPIT